MHNSVATIFQESVQNFGARPCVSYKNKAGKYQDINWNEMADMVHNLGTYLIARGVKQGDRVALFAPNRYEWWVADLAILSIGAVNVPIYATNTPQESAYVLKDSGSRICFAGTSDQVDNLLNNPDNQLDEVISFDPIATQHPNLSDFSKCLNLGRQHQDQREFERRLQAIASTDIATLIYTSGTTGNPKGVTLAHSNLVANTMQCRGAIYPMLESPKVLLSFLPLSHAFERIVGYYLAIQSGSQVYFAENHTTVAQNLKEVHPSMLVSVPRLYEKLHAGVLAQAETASGLKRKIFDWSLRQGKKNLPYICNNKPRRGIFALKYALAHKLVLGKIKDALGVDRLQVVISGGGPLAVADAEFTLGLGVPITEGFGLSETSPVTNVNRPDFIKPGTIGPAIPETQQMISPEGELLIKGPQVMQGYYNNEEATRAAFTADGWLKTGDLASIDEDGYVTITGRLKDIIITAGGKNISPQNLENSLKESPYIDQVCIIGDRRKFLSALIIPSFEKVEAWAGERGLKFGDYAEMVENDQVVGLIEQEVRLHSEHFSRASQIKKFKLLAAEWTQETDELTPTSKVKRAVINKKYASVIEEIYA